MRRYGGPIQNAAVRHPLKHGITTSRRYEEFDACIEAGLDPGRWMAGEYARDLMARVVAWYRLKASIEAHVEDARARAIERQQKKHR